MSAAASWHERRRRLPCSSPSSQSLPTSACAVAGFAAQSCSRRLGRSRRRLDRAATTQIWSPSPTSCIVVARFGDPWLLRPLTTAWTRREPPDCIATLSSPTVRVNRLDSGPALSTPAGSAPSPKLDTGSIFLAPKLDARPGQPNPPAHGPVTR
jgi:hypothetical protein